MKPLRITVPLGADETPASFTSRLAAANRLPAREFCLDWNIRFQAVVDGQPHAIAVIAGVGGVDAATLANNAFVSRSKRQFEHRSELFVRDALRRSRVWVCPACLQGDIRRHPDFAPRLAVYNRGIWTIGAIRTCPVHDTALTEIATAIGPHTLHDFVFQIEPALPSIDRLARSAPRGRPTELETYVTARLDGARASPFLDSLHLHVAIRMCEIFGAVELYGRNANLNRLGDDEWRPAGAAGFKITAGGAEAIEAYLDRLQETYPRARTGKERPQGLFGRVYQWLNLGRNPALDPIRNIVGNYILTHFPFGPGDRLFGKPVTQRVTHSIFTLSKAAGVHPTRLRKTMRAAGLIDDAQLTLTDNRVLFDAKRACAVLQKGSTAVSLPETAAYIKAPLKQAMLLAANGFIQPYMQARTLGARDRYALGDLDSFLERLSSGAQPVRTARPGMFDLPAAARRARCSTAEIIRLILDRKLSWTGRALDRRGYMSVLVKLDEIIANVRRPGYGGLTKGEVMERLRATHAVVTALVANGHLPVVPAKNRVNCRHRFVFRPEDVAHFERQYVSLAALCSQSGRHFRSLLKAIAVEGIEPAFDVEKVGARFYSRCDLALQGA